MSFFGKLRQRMFRSSSRIEEGIGAIVEEGGAAEEAPRDEPRDLASPEASAPEARRGEPAQPLPEGGAASRPDPAPTTPGRRAAFPPLEPMPSAEGAAPAGEREEVEERPGFFGRLLGRQARTVVRRELDDAMLESLEELLIASDMGVDTALRVTAALAEGRMGRRFSTEEIQAALASEIARVMEPVATPMPLYARKPQVVLVVGVNGSGKTTTIGKLASQFRAAGKSVVIAAGDTFRAAAVEQLQVWGERAGVPVMTAPQGSDPASLAFDAMGRAQAEGADLLMIDTAGRLQNRADLMEELAKIVRVIRKRDPVGAAQHAARARRHHGAERAQPGGGVPPLGRRVRTRDDQARRHGAGRRTGGARGSLRAAHPRHRRGRADRRPGPLRPGGVRHGPHGRRKAGRVT